jgi:hypothetical protein
MWRLLDKSLRSRKQPVYEPAIEVVRNLSRTLVNQWIRDHFRIEGYDCTEDWNSECLIVSLKQYDYEARRSVAQWRKDILYDGAVIGGTPVRTGLLWASPGGKLRNLGGLAPARTLRWA